MIRLNNHVPAIFSMELQVQTVFDCATVERSALHLAETASVGHLLTTRMGDIRESWIDGGGQRHVVFSRIRAYISQCQIDSVKRARKSSSVDLGALVWIGPLTVLASIAGVLVTRFVAMPLLSPTPEFWPLNIGLTVVDTGCVCVLGRLDIQACCLAGPGPNWNIQDYRNQGFAAFLVARRRHRHLTLPGSDMAARFRLDGGARDRLGDLRVGADETHQEQRRDPRWKKDL